MIRWIQQWLQPVNSQSVESLSTDEAGEAVLDKFAQEWYMELGGERVALLSCHCSQGWMPTRYHITFLTEDEETLKRLRDIEFWWSWEKNGVVFRNRRTSATTFSSMFLDFDGEDAIRARSFSH